MATYPRRPSYSIFVRFRRSRLALRRGIVSLEEALAAAEQIRANRFHDRGDVFVVKEPEGVVVDSGLEAQPGLPGGAPIIEEGRPRPHASVDDEEAPALPRSAAASPTPPVDEGGPERSGFPRPRVGRPLDSLLRLSAQVERMGRAADRARAAQARFDSACLTAEDTLSRLAQAPGGGAPPGAGPFPGLRQSVDRALALRASAARSIASFEQVTLLFRRRVEAVWAESTQPPDLPR